MQQQLNKVPSIDEVDITKKPLNRTVQDPDMIDMMEYGDEDDDGWGEDAEEDASPDRLSKK